MRYVGLSVLMTVLALTQPSVSVGDDFDREPINYGTTQPRDCISRLQKRLDQAETTLKYTDSSGYLQSVLSELQVSPTTQMLVFSKTSLQRQCITPETPRAVYFNDEVYVGFCREGEVLEISAVDPQLGMVFYTLEQRPDAQPKFVRQTDSCLLCHGSSQSHGVPGNLVRSVYPDAGGFPILSSGSFRIDQTSPIEKRWGGWYVSGEHGTHKHLGNLIIHGKKEPEEIDNSQGLNVTDLTPRLNLKPYLTPHSDIVALMVLEHQAMAHNLIIQANFSTRQALHYQAQLNLELKEPPGHRWASTLSRIRSVGDPLVKYLLFSGEARLQSPIKGTAGFTDQFAKQGPRDTQGRSLRDFDLQTRLFKYPCSYLVYSPVFDALPADVRDYVLQRMWDVLNGKDSTPEFAHLSTADRTAIREILIATKPSLPAYWKVEPRLPK
ncbi:MAG: hypothetical protein JWN70_1306 [Planctomycetaceae bacterium]|nr:hypothetical protein [Planctomycetaceae bacterium]